MKEPLVPPTEVDPFCKGNISVLSTIQVSIRTGELTTKPNIFTPRSRNALHCINELNNYLKYGKSICGAELAKDPNTGEFEIFCKRDDGQECPSQNDPRIHMPPSAAK